MKNKKTSHTQTFRAGVGAVILNKDGLVLGLERKDIPGAWQLPQGGLDADESPLEAVKREVLEETGIEASDLELLATAPRWLAYELPEECTHQKDRSRTGTALVPVPVYRLRRGDHPGR